MREISPAEVAKHNTKEDCWVIIHGKVYDLTEFLPEHPGGSSIILKYAGKDATKPFDPIHPADIIEKLLPPSVLMGNVDTSHASKTAQDEVLTEEEREREEARKLLPPLSQMLNMRDFEYVARKVLRPDGWAYYSSGADDEVTMRENNSAFQRIWLKPRVLVNVKNVDISSTILGYQTSVPLYITATALGKLGHPEGEVALAKAAGAEGIIQMIPTLSSCSLDEVTSARSTNQVQFFQLYVNSNREITKQLIKRAENNGCKALFITVDAPVLAKREKDMRLKFSVASPDVQDEKTVDRSQGAARAIGSFIDVSLSWDDLPWFKSVTSLPIVLKGVQTAEDAVLAYKHGIAGIVVSNHGGRQLEYSRSAIEVLPEIMRELRDEHAPSSFEVYVDGGIRRGTDIFKALALGAKAVGIGRPFLYAMSGYGTEGVRKAIQILKDELEMVMRLMGVTRIQDLRPEMLVIGNLSSHISTVPKNNLSLETYEKMKPVSLISTSKL